MTQEQYIILGAGVIGLTTALELKATHPNFQITIVAKHLPGDRDMNYCSPWAGANWLSVATDNGRQESWDRITYEKFDSFCGPSTSNASIGIYRTPILAYFDNEPADAGVLSQDTGKIWYETLVGGLRHVPTSELLSGAKWGFECNSFVLDTGRYLAWLQNQCLSQGIDIHRKSFASLDEAFASYPDAKALFNCTGLGSYHLEDVKDTSLYPTRGQVLLVEQPDPPINKMYFKSPKRVAADTTYIFPRGPNGGIILGGCRDDGVWEGDVRMDFAEDIKRRCCELCPALGRPEDLKVVSHGVGLRPGRKGGARIEKEVRGEGRVIVHNYGAGGAGYQASWGMAREAVMALDCDKVTIDNDEGI